MAFGYLIRSLIKIESIDPLDLIIIRGINKQSFEKLDRQFLSGCLFSAFDELKETSISKLNAISLIRNLIKAQKTIVFSNVPNLGWWCADIRFRIARLFETFLKDHLSAYKNYWLSFNFAVDSLNNHIIYYSGYDLSIRFFYILIRKCGSFARIAEIHFIVLKALENSSTNIDPTKSFGKDLFNAYNSIGVIKRRAEDIKALNYLYDNIKLLKGTGFNPDEGGIAYFFSIRHLIPILSGRSFQNHPA